MVVLPQGMHVQEEDDADPQPVLAKHARTAWGKRAGAAVKQVLALLHCMYMLTSPAPRLYL